MSSLSTEEYWPKTFYLRREYLVLRQNAVDRGPESGLHDFRSGVPKNVVGEKVGTDAVSDIPPFDVLSNGDDLAAHVRTWNRVLLLIERVLA